MSDKSDELTQMEHIAEKMLREMLERGYVPSEITPLKTFSLAENSVLVFKLRTKLPHGVRENLVKNFDRWLAEKKICGLYLPPDIDLVAVLNKTERVENVIIEACEPTRGED